MRFHSKKKERKLHNNFVFSLFSRANKKFPIFFKTPQKTASNDGKKEREKKWLKIESQLKYAKNFIAFLCVLSARKMRKNLLSGGIYLLCAHKCKQKEITILTYYFPQYIFD